jgi:GLPGLI family protein
MNKIFFLFLFISSIVVSQSKLELTYKVKSHGKPLEFDKSIEQEILPYLISMEKELEDLKFTLQVKGKESLWFLNDRDTYPMSHLGQSFAGNTSYYFDANAEEYLTQEFFLGNLFLISKKIKKLNWELVDEQKLFWDTNVKKQFIKKLKR